MGQDPRLREKFRRQGARWFDRLTMTKGSLRAEFIEAPQ
jgi:hypothetical protein